MALIVADPREEPASPDYRVNRTGTVPSPCGRAIIGGNFRISVLSAKSQEIGFYEIVRIICI